MGSLNTIEEIEARQAEITSRLGEIDSEFAGQRFTDEARSEWNDLNGELEANKEFKAELEARAARVAELATRDENVEPEKAVYRRVTGRGDSRVPDDVFDVAEYRRRSTSDQEHRQALRDGALKAIEMSQFANPRMSQEDAQSNVSRLIDTIDHDSALARRVLECGSPTYYRAWGKAVASGGVQSAGLTSEEQRALAIGTQGGNYPVPITLDPSVILVSNGQVNPLREISRVVQITGNTWNGVMSTGISAGYGAELTEASDNSPTLTGPAANVEKAQAFVPFSIENAEDWGSLVSEMSVMFQDAKDALEATKFLSGAGHGSTEPQGLLVGATAVVTTAATATFAVADLYSTVQALAERWQPNATILANRAALNKVRQFDTAGGASMWVQLQAGYPQRLLDYPTHVYSSMSSAVTTSAATILTIGDFNQFLILDRIGMEVELIPHLFATANNRPYGARGLYCYWRNTTSVLTPLAFKSTKLL